MDFKKLKIVAFSFLFVLDIVLGCMYGFDTMKIIATVACFAIVVMTILGIGERKK